MFGGRSPLFRVEIHNCKCCNFETRKFKVGKISCCFPSKCCLRKKKKKAIEDEEKSSQCEEKKESSLVDASVQTDRVVVSASVH